MYASPSVSALRTYRDARDLFLGLLLLGLCLEGLYLALFPLLAGHDPEHDPLFLAWHTFLPWLPLPYWTGWLHLPWFDPHTLAGNARLLLAILVLALFGVLLAAQIGRVRRNISPRSQRTCAWLILSFAACFALTILISPPHLDIFSRDMVLSWLAGRMVVIYHVNPYIMTPAAYPQDVATRLLVHFPPDTISLSSSPVGTTGPVGIDIGVLVSLLGRDQIAHTLLSFRIVGLLLHLGNALFIWLILRRNKPEQSISALVLYAWNPLFLLLGVAQIHQELATIFFVLLAIYFLQRDASVLSWFFLLLALLINTLCLLVLPLFLCMIMCKTRFLVLGEQFFLWLALLVLPPIVFGLAYLPYWDGWAWNGLISNMALTFFPPHPLNSLDAMLLKLPLPQAILKLFNPVYWCSVLLGFLGLFLLFSFWLADTIDLLLVCASWVLLIFLTFQPLYWPWYVLLPLALILCSAHGKTLLLGIFLLIGALVNYYCWSSGLHWDGQAILVLGSPCLLWGWCMFFISTWKMTQRREELAMAQESGVQRPRSPWLSRPSWPSRPGKL